MKRILVPLDGSKIATSILPDACDLAGSGGTVVLMHDVTGSTHEPETGDDNLRVAIEHSDRYLKSAAEDLRHRGITVEVETVFIADSAVAIDEAAKIYHADMIACATHGRSPLGRLVRGGVAWRAVANSPVPVMLRHIEDAALLPWQTSATPRILVPIDGSDSAETALPVAIDLARQWNAELFLMQVIPDFVVNATPFGVYSGTPDSLDTDARNAQAHLDSMAATSAVGTHVTVTAGDVVGKLVHAVSESNITHVVMASHGRTGLARIILGSIADELIHKLHCPIVLVPALVGQKVDGKTRERELDRSVVPV